jgi:hypothetical protein
VRHAAFDVRGYFLACFFCDDFWNDMESVQCVANTFFFVTSGWRVKAYCSLQERRTRKKMWRPRRAVLWRLCYWTMSRLQ